jgi:hypothetical protein
MTIDAAGAGPAPPMAAEPPKNVFQRIAGVLFAPGETFADIARRPDILWPLLLFVAIGYVTTFVMVPRMDFEAAFAEQAVQMKKQNPNMSDDDIERVGRIGRASMKVMQFIGPLIGVLVYVVIALVLWGAARMMGGQGDYKQALSATLYAWVPLVLFSIILTIVAVARGSIDPTQMAVAVKSNPAFLVDMKEHPVLFSLLSIFDVFTIWTIVLLVFGFSALTRLSKAKMATIIIVLFAVAMMVKVGFAALGAARA